MKKIVVTGPESSGKTSLVEAVNKESGVIDVNEYARKFIGALTRPYKCDDLITIAKGQLVLEQEAVLKDPEILLCDTDLLTIKIWSEYKYGSCDPFIHNKLMENLPDLYLLTSPDFPWEPDPQRENPDDRDEFFSIYKQHIIDLEVPYEVLMGPEQKRVEKVLEIIRY